MGNPITHSDFFKLLQAMAGKGTIPFPVADELIKLTSFGVLAEGADFPAAANQAAPKPEFTLGAASRNELIGVDNRLCRCVERAIKLTTQDFTVFDGLRTESEQRKLVQRGMSRTMNSKHLKGLAVDLVPWVNGKPVWEWERIYPIAYAMDRAATELGIASKIRWGGAWDRVLSDFGGSREAYALEVAEYCKRHPGKDFIDGPHFEWVG